MMIEYDRFSDDFYLGFGEDIRFRFFFNNKSKDSLIVFKFKPF